MYVQFQTRNSDVQQNCVTLSVNLFRIFLLTTKNPQKLLLQKMYTLSLQKHQ